MRKALLLLLPLVARPTASVANSFKPHASAELRSSFGIEALPSRLRPAFSMPFRAPLAKQRFAGSNSVLRGGGIDKAQILNNARYQYIPCLIDALE
jgi:hypothetical protein